MERKMTIFAKHMVEDNIELLYDLVCKKYKKFKLFYRLVESISDDIQTLEYEFTSDTSLHVSILPNDDVDVIELIGTLQTKFNTTDYMYTLSSKGRKVKIIITSD